MCWLGRRTRGGVVSFPWSRAHGLGCSEITRSEATTAREECLRDTRLGERVAASPRSCLLRGGHDGVWYAHVWALLTSSSRQGRLLESRAQPREAPRPLFTRRRHGVCSAELSPAPPRVGRSIEFMIPKKRGGLAPRFRHIRSWRPGRYSRLHLSFRFGMASRRCSVPARTQAVLSAPVMSASCPDREC